VDINAIAGAAAAASHVATLVKGVTVSLKASGKAEALGAVIELQEAVMDLQQRQFELGEKYRELASENEELKRALKEQGDVDYKFQCYWRKRAGGTFDGPFSAERWDTERKLVRLDLVGHREDVDEFVFRCRNSDEPACVPTSFIRDNQIMADEEIHLAIRRSRIIYSSKGGGSY